MGYFLKGVALVATAITAKAMPSALSKQAEASMPLALPRQEEASGRNITHAIFNGDMYAVIEGSDVLKSPNPKPQASPPPAINSPTPPYTTINKDIILVTVIPTVIAILGWLGYQRYRNGQRGVADNPGTEMNERNGQQPSPSPLPHLVSPPLVEQRGYARDV